MNPFPFYEGQLKSQITLNRVFLMVFEKAQTGRQYAAFPSERVSRTAAALITQEPVVIKNMIVAMRAQTKPLPVQALNLFSLSPQSVRLLRLISI